MMMERLRMLLHTTGTCDREIDLADHGKIYYLNFIAFMNDSDN